MFLIFALDGRAEFKVNRGLRRGDAVASLLLNVVLETAIEGPKAETKGTAFDKCSQIMVCGDDALLWEEDREMYSKYSHHWQDTRGTWDWK